LIGQTISHYRILNELGRGTMGVVYVAEDINLQRPVAFKVLTDKLDLPQFRERMLREARVISALNHRRIATVHEYGETEQGLPFIVMELVKGQTLGELLSGGAMSLPGALEIIEGVAEGLAEAHARGIVHRDIKPSNIAVTERGEVKILDFGLAKQVGVSADGADAGAQQAALTTDGLTVGTPLYMSPEQAQGGVLDTRSDLFSLGSLLYECITGRPAFDDRNAIAVCARVIRDDPPPPSSINPEVPPELDRITLKALAKKVEARYQKADEMLADIGAARRQLTHGDPPAPAPALPEPVTPDRSVITTLIDTIRKPRTLFGVFLVTLVLSVFLGWLVPRLRRGGTEGSVRVEVENYYKDGVNALRDGTYYKAIRALEKAVSLDKNFVPARARLAEAWSDLDYIDRAKNELLQVSAALRDDPALPPLESLYVQAINLKLSGDTQGAIEKYLAVVGQASGPEKAAAYVDLGRAYERDGNVKKAVEAYGEARALDPQFTAASVRLGALLGRQLGQEGTEAALAAFQDAETRYRILNDLEGQAEVFYERGVLFTAKRRTEEARGQLTEGLSKASAIDNKYQQIKIRMQLSNVSCVEGDTAEARRSASEVLDFAKNNDLEILAINGLVNLGNAFMARGDPGPAEEYLERALSLARFYRARRGQARAALALASTYTRHQGKADRVREYVEQASAIYHQEGYRKLAMQAQALLGHANDQLGDYGAALSAFEQQLRLAEQTGDQEQAALAHDGLGIVLTHGERYPESLKHLDEAYRISRQLRLRPFIGHTLLARGRTLCALGRYKEAQDSFEEALRVAGEADEPGRELLAWLQLSKAQLALSRRQLEAAKAESRKALELAGEGHGAVAAEAQYTLGLAFALTGDPQQGQRLCQAALDAAKRSGEPRLVGGALLALSAALLEGGDPRAALASALEAQKIFERSSQRDSEWRAWSVAALASRRTDDEAKARECARQVAELLSSLRQDWGAPYSDYASRPDVQFVRMRLKREFDLNT
jgi:tetratricopeptide (TPR) repeat protein/predicted Ser/Thr protein kinase